MPDNLNRALTLTGSGPFMSLFTLSLSLTHTLSLYLSTLSLYLSVLINTHSIECVFMSRVSFSFHAHSLSLSLHTPSLYRHTLPLSLLQKTLLPSLCTHFPSLSLSLSLSLSIHSPPSLSLSLFYTHSLSLYTLPLFQNILLPLSAHTFHLSVCLSLSLSLSLCTLSLSLQTHTHSLPLPLHALSNKICIRYNMKVLNFHIITNTNLIWEH